MAVGGPSKERVWGETIRQAEQRAREKRFVADVRPGRSLKEGPAA